MVTAIGFLLCGDGCGSVCCGGRASEAGECGAGIAVSWAVVRGSEQEVRPRKDSVYKRAACCVCCGWHERVDVHQSGHEGQPSADLRLVAVRCRCDAISMRKVHVSLTEK